MELIGGSDAFCGTASSYLEEIVKILEVSSILIGSNYAIALSRYPLHSK